MFKGENYTFPHSKQIFDFGFILDKARSFKLCMIITFLGVYIVIIGLMTMTLLQSQRCLRNINCNLHALDSCLCLLNVWLVHTLKRLCTI